jgi:hypothetical protein
MLQRFVSLTLVLLVGAASVYYALQSATFPEAQKDYVLTDCNGCSEAAHWGRQASHGLSYSRSETAVPFIPYRTGSPTEKRAAITADWQPDQAETERCDRSRLDSSDAGASATLACRCGWDGKALPARCFGVDREPKPDAPAESDGLNTPGVREVGTAYGARIALAHRLPSRIRPV